MGVRAPYQVEGVEEVMSDARQGELLWVEHRRYPAGKNRWDHAVALVGLATGEVSIGVALLSKRDVYSRKIGYRIALGRALRKPFVQFTGPVVANGRDVARWIEPHMMHALWTARTMAASGYRGERVL